MSEKSPALSRTAARIAADLGEATLSPLDGRYRPAVEGLLEHLSEPALNRERLRIEVAWLLHLTKQQVLPGVRRLTDVEVQRLHGIAADFDADTVTRLREIERVTVHDVKAVEYLLKERLAGTSLADVSEVVHFACTSEDINNLAYARLVQRAVREVWLPAATSLVDQVATLARQYRSVPMLARTHGQPATPTTMGKELAVLAHRLRRQLDRVTRADFLGKMNGATGTYAAHHAAAPDVDWQSVSRDFVEGLGLTWNPLTTQIESHDWQAELYADVQRYNRVLHNLCTDAWTYISQGYFTQVAPAGSIGSSTMPHKVNPIRFENAEANLELSDGLLEVLQRTLTTSRLQRDLTDSTTQRNIGVALGHSLLAIDNAARGLASLDVDSAVLDADLESSWEVLGEAVQTVMRLHGLENPYERLKELTRGKRVDGPAMTEFVRGLGLPQDVTDRLVALTPQTYTGIADELVDHLAPAWSPQDGADD
ncbi:adenylosuccinate lyase [Aquipuribacter sp. MA13-6]|uniref:adenylosuccinate lyase n=1 Tax=unclassified Aquipuribacter TaxID=2635084 RepID=UPI003EEDECB1